MPSINDSKCILIIGGTSGIGRSLALSIQALPSKPMVIVSGRRQDRLDALAKENNLEIIRFDVDADRETLRGFVDDVTKKYPQLDAVLFCAGIQYTMTFKKPVEINLDNFTKELNVNYMAIVTMITFFLPHLLKLERPGFIIPVTSGLAFLPAAWVTGYCATKAALHSFSLSLNAQLADTNVHVMEIIPPLVESELHDAEGTTEHLSKFWMPLDKFTEQTMTGLKEGKAQIAINMDAGWNRWESGKLEEVKTFLKQQEGW